MKRSGTFVDAWQGLFSKPVPNLVLRAILMFVGIIGIGLGVALAKLATMGTAPISSMPAVLTEVSVRYGIPMTMGMWTFVFNLCFFVLELVLLRRDFKPVQFLQIPLFFVLSASIDMWLLVFTPIAPEGYLWQLLWLLVSVVVLGLAIRVQLASDLLMTPGDAAVQVISYVSRRPFSRCKVIWDVSLMSLAALTSLVFLGGLYQVREGTIIAALLVGPMVRVADRLLSHAPWLVPATSRVLVPPLCPEVPESPRDAEECGNALEYDYAEE